LRNSVLGVAFEPHKSSELEKNAIGIFCTFSLGGGNDSQKVMGIIAAAVAVYMLQPRRYKWILG
jgi:hypothetical protein